MDSTERDARVFELSEQLLEIEQRLIPTGLHVFGRATSAGEQTDLLKMVASFDRPEAGARALNDLIAESLGLSYAEIIDQHATNEAGCNEREKIDQLASDSVERLLSEGSGAASRWLEDHANVPAQSSQPMFQLLQGIATELETRID